MQPNEEPDLSWQPSQDRVEPPEPGASPAPGTPVAAPVQPSAVPGKRASGRGLVAMALSVAMVAALASSAATYVLAYSAAGGTKGATSATTVSAVLTSSSGSLVAAIGKANASVVTIDTSGSGGPFGQQVSGVGTGIIVSSNGLILTNAHVVSGASSIQVTLPSGKTVSGTVYGTSSTTDLAIVKVNATGLTAATLRTTAPAVGETVLAIGNPLGEFTDSVTAGIISGLNRSITVENENLTGLIQTDTPVNAGNSGGPLVDVNGDVVGVVTASSSNAQGISFAIPITAATSMVSQAIAGHTIS